MAPEYGDEERAGCERGPRMTLEFAVFLSRFPFVSKSLRVVPRSGLLAGDRAFYTVF
jgi:hypothetical protein